MEADVRKCTKLKVAKVQRMSKEASELVSK